MTRAPDGSGGFITEGHLGGTSPGGDPDSWFPELWVWLKETLGLNSVLDVGCGCGHAMCHFESLGMWAIGIEGSPLVIASHLSPRSVVRHDLTEGPFLLPRRADLVWCCEVAEHLDAAHATNVARTVAGNAGKALAFCAAPPGAGGHHHVNCREPAYWRALIEEEGLIYSPELTDEGRALCVPSGRRGPSNYFRRSGMIFLRPDS